MGLIKFGLPADEALYLKELMKLDVFVEGGTYKGGTSIEMSSQFREVFTVEKSDTMFDIAKESLQRVANVIQLKGDTRDHLSNILEKNDNILFWLDAHWSGGDTYGEEDECPLLDELEIIFKFNKNYIILIDDARLFLAPPPLPHDYTNWPSLTDILKLIPDNWELLEFEDVMYLFPKKISNEFKLFMQQKATEGWKAFGKANEDSFVKGFKIMLKGILKGKV